jgi:hypothetical protein
LPLDIRIHRADNDTRVPGTRALQRDELPAVECQDGAIAFHGEIQNLLVGDGSVRLSGFLRC